MNFKKINAAITAECTRRQWQNPIIRQKMIEGISKAGKKLWDDPLYHAVRSEQVRLLNTKLRPEQREEIARRYMPRDPINGARALAKEFGLHHRTILRIVAEKSDDF
jgi:hypothetical protein